MRIQVPGFVILCAGAVLGLVAASAAVRAADPDALWKIVHGRCVPDQTLNNDPAPCTALSLVGGEAGGHAILKDIRGATQFLLIPTARIGGIESPEILAADAPNYFAAAWAARARMEVVLHRPLPPEDIGLAINSPHSRSQEQLHIHIDCLRPDVVAALHAQAGAIGTGWVPLPLLGHHYRARWLPEAALATSNPFKLLAEDVGPAAMGDQTLVVAGAVSPDGAPGFVLLADRYDPASGDRAGGEELQDHDCAVTR
jgi:CDP-diacylglycerol pyrophosphatase